MDWKKKVITQDIYIRERVDKYCMEQFGDLENKILDEEYIVKQAVFRGIFELNRDNQPVVAMLTERHEIVIFDIQKQRVSSYLVSHSDEVISIDKDHQNRY